MTITIITPSFRRSPDIVRRCLASVDAQTYPGWRHIVCSDGGYSDDIRRLCTHPKRSYHHTGKTLGHFGAGVRAAILPKAQSEFVAFLDDDNILLPRFCEIMLNALEADPSAEFAICPILHFGPIPGRTGLKPWVLTGLPPRIGCIDTLNIVVRTAAMLKTGWSLSGFTSDGTTYERLATLPYTVVDEVLAVHL